MNHVVVTIQLIDDQGEVQSMKEVVLDEIRLPEQPENVLDRLEERAEDVGRKVTRTVMAVEWEELDRQAVAEVKRSFSP